MDFCTFILKISKICSQVAEFMDTYPVPIRREHFAEFRTFLRAQLAETREEFATPSRPPNADSLVFEPKTSEKRALPDALKGGEASFLCSRHAGRTLAPSRLSHVIQSERRSRPLGPKPVSQGNFRIALRPAQRSFGLWAWPTIRELELPPKPGRPGIRFSIVLGTFRFQESPPRQQ